MPENNEKVLITGISKQQPDFDYTMTELGELAKANNYTVVGEMRQNVDRQTAATYFGSGKVDEIRQEADILEATTVLVNDELSPSQLRNLEKQLGRRVVDRTQLILDIFADRARSKTAKTQVEIAQLKYALPRLHPSANRLDQQGGGGGFANRGAGETQLEMDRRILTKRIAHLRQDLRDADVGEEVRRAKRQTNQLPVVALVGYTNAGKSTTMNGLLDLYADRPEDKQVFEKDMLFATLDTSVRALTLPDNRQFLLSDTVGFVSKLPHNLIDSFKATLAEAANADLLIQVVDYADPNYREMMAITEKTLKEIGIENIPMIEAYNKADKREDTTYPEINGHQLVYSAKDPKSLKALTEMITQLIFAEDQEKTYLVPFTDGQIVSFINEKTAVKATDYTETGTKITTIVNAVQAGQLEKYEVTE
ncbi:GTPase HflX [Lacticaseibacillus saniviri]|uniref:GTPase HflX n=1 Tax=Lacticaseibacillus saniviri JCM 17471 = DSM 24301 TaxID=1293598 RepID=A0A0R2MUQ8_9LACO|nr:GTPase HflX [Lacticaseibacillus saniviri]KRO17145.1 GTP-binding protein protease [Lacticaseibacillus saniviri JCM 17471 = DSM 24301]MCG4282609.1 GTPase HflX [Lacticaseibacillus saniviri]